MLKPNLVFDSKHCQWSEIPEFKLQCTASFFAPLYNTDSKFACMIETVNVQLACMMHVYYSDQLMR